MQEHHGTQISPAPLREGVHERFECAPIALERECPEHSPIPYPVGDQVEGRAEWEHPAGNCPDQRGQVGESGSTAHIDVRTFQAVLDGVTQVRMLPVQLVECLGRLTRKGEAGQLERVHQPLVHINLEGRPRQLFQLRDVKPPDVMTDQPLDTRDHLLDLRQVLSGEQPRLPPTDHRAHTEATFLDFEVKEDGLRGQIRGPSATGHTRKIEAGWAKIARICPIPD